MVIARSSAMRCRISNRIRNPNYDDGVLETKREAVLPDPASV
jgi:hypothetical protein